MAALNNLPQGHMVSLVGELNKKTLLQWRQKLINSRTILLILQRFETKGKGSTQRISLNCINYSTHTAEVKVELDPEGETLKVAPVQILQTRVNFYLQADVFCASAIVLVQLLPPFFHCHWAMAMVTCEATMMSRTLLSRSLKK